MGKIEAAVRASLEANCHIHLEEFGDSGKIPMLDFDLDKAATEICQFEPKPNVQNEELLRRTIREILAQPAYTTIDEQVSLIWNVLKEYGLVKFSHRGKAQFKTAFADELTR